jgi:hypothetical protein
MSAQRVRVLCIEIVPGIAGAIHHDLCGHRHSPLQGTLGFD